MFSYSTQDNGGCQESFLKRKFSRFCVSISMLPVLFYMKFLAWIGLLELKHGLIHHWVNSDVLISMIFYGELQSNPDSIDLTCKSKFWIIESVIITSSHCTSYNSDYALMLYCRMQKPCIQSPLIIWTDLNGHSVFVWVWELMAWDATYRNSYASIPFSMFI